MTLTDENRCPGHRLTTPDTPLESECVQCALRVEPSDPRAQGITPPLALFPVCWARKTMQGAE
jgi:hypothetical protein